MIVIAGGDVVLPDRILASASLVIDGGRIATVEPSPRMAPQGAVVVQAAQCFIVPGFIDVHVHGVAGYDTLDEGDPLLHIASRLPQYGVTAFCPTSVACTPSALRTMLTQVAALRVKNGGGLAGHNGLRSIKSHLHSDAFVRVRIGVSKPVSKQQGADHVLSRFGKRERTEIEVTLEQAADAIETIAADGVDAAMNRFN